MRSTILPSIPVGLVLGVLLVFGVQLAVSGSADADDKADAKIKKLERSIEGLRAQVAYLRSREDALTAYVLANDTRAADFAGSMKRARDQGFTKKSIPEASRTTLLNGLSSMAESLRQELPALTKEEERLRKKADALSK